MKLSELVPSADLLEKLEGLEDGLKQRRRLGRLGMLGTAIAFLTWLSSVLPLLPSSLKDWLSRVPAPWGAIVTASLVLALLLAFLAILFSFWLKESRRRIRYTCSLGHFSPVCSDDNKPSLPVKEKMGWLRQDLAQRLNQRVGRLMFLLSPDGEPPTQPAEKEAESGPERHTDQHIHIEGVYHAQNKKDPQDAEDAWELVVMPRVRIGRADSPENLAKPVFYPVPEYPELSVDQYEELIEQVYFNVVSEVYQQIRQDVERKIALLPTRRHKAVAYYYEAEDYARSNTLRSYEEAYQLYREASRHFEPFNPLVNPLPKSRLLRMWRALDRAVDTQAKNLFRLLYHVRPTLARHEVLAARAKLGCANMLLFRSQLSQLLGHRPVPMYEARRFAEQALDSITQLPEDVTRLPDHADGRKRSLFDGHVTNALSWSMLREYAKSRDHLQRAKSIDPHRATTSTVYLFAESLAPAESQQKYEKLVCAVEQDQTFEIAKFSKAFEREMRWRRAPSPTSAQIEAGLVVEEYRDVLKLNPSNIGAAANAAFVLWALAGEDESGNKKNIKKAKQFLDLALRYNELAPETVVVEHHYGLARIYAEEGDFERAYEHLVKAEDGRRAHRSTHSVESISYFFAFVGDDLMRRYEAYRNNVLAHISQGSDEEPYSACNAVCAFVLDEFGQACWSHYSLYSRDENTIKRAIGAFNDSIKKDKTYVMSYYHLAQVCSTPQERTDLLEKVTRLDPSWQDALLKLAVYKGYECSYMLSDAKKNEDEALNLEELKNERENLDELNKQRLEREREFRERDIGPESSPVSVDQQLSDIRRKIVATEKTIQELKARLPEEARETQDLKNKADNARRRAEDLRKEVNKRKDEIQKTAGKLLPHEWLWASAVNPHERYSESNFTEQSITNPRYKAEAKWEREFNSLQVDALCEWAKPLLWAHDENGGLGRILLHHIKEVFLPADFSLLLDLQTIAEDEELHDLRVKAGQIVYGWLLDNPCSRAALEWIDDYRIKLAPNIQIERLKAARESGHLPSHLLQSLLQSLASEQVEDGNKKFMDPRESEKAAESYRKALELNAGGPETGLAAGRLAALLLAEKSLNEAEPLVEQSLPETYTLLPSAVKDADGDVERFLMNNELARIELKLCYERRLRTDTDRFATDAVMGLLRVPSCEKNRSTEYNNVRTALAVEWDETLLPSDVDDFLVNQAARPLRQRLEEHYGVLIPGIRFRPLTEGVRPGLYRILDHEVVVEEGIAKGRVPSSAPDIEENWQNPLWFTMDRLEIYLERHLSQWIRVQEVLNLLDTHCQEQYLSNISAFETHKHIGPLTIVIRSLVAERVPIRQFAKIYELYQSLWDAGEHVQAMTREIRKDRAIRPELWGNKQEYRRFVLSESAEAELWDACESIDGFTALVLNPRRREEIVSAIMAGIKAEGKKSLTIRQSILRPLVRRLIEPKLPDVPVLAEEEVECHVRAIECIEIPIPPRKKSKG